MLPQPRSIVEVFCAGLVVVGRCRLPLLLFGVPTGQWELGLGRRRRGGATRSLQSPSSPVCAQALSAGLAAIRSGSMYVSKGPLSPFFVGPWRARWTCDVGPPVKRATIANFCFDR